MREQRVSELIAKIRELGLDHDVLKSITVIEGIAINVSPLRIGKGVGSLGEVDLPVLRDPRGVPYIPGSSLKGAIRASLEAIARGSGLRVCTPFNSSECSFGAEFLNFVLQKALTSSTMQELKESILGSSEFIVAIAGRRGYPPSKVDELLARVRQSAPDELIKIVEEYAPCPICRLFGNQALASRVTLFDAYPCSPDGVATYIRTRVAIDRLREAARSGALFEYEFVPPGYEWRFRIEIRNIDLVECKDPCCKLLKTLLKNMTEFGIAIGGMKSVGHGILKLNPERTQVITYRVKDLSLVVESKYVLADLVRGG